MGANYLFVRLQIYVGWKWSWSNSRWNGYSLVYTSLLTRQNYAKECDILCQSLVKNKKLVKRKKKHYDNIKNYILMLQFLHSTISKIIEGEKAIFLERNFFFQAEDGIRDCLLSRGLGDVYKRQVLYQDQRICLWLFVKL